MRVRIKYSKQGLMKYIGHLDMMRSFQKILRRAGIDVTFSEGYSPHMVMSYAFPLGVGMTSDSEYVDVDLNRAYDSVDLIRKLNEEAPQGVHFLDASEIPPGKVNKGMTVVARADYTLSFREGHEWPEGWKKDFEKWIRQPGILAVKKGKKTEKEINIAPLIYKATVDPEEFEVRGIADSPTPAGMNRDHSASSVPAGGSGVLPAVWDNVHRGDLPAVWDNVRRGDLYLALSAGMADNIRPELVVKTFAEQCGYPHEDFRFHINRDEVFADTAAEDPRKRDKETENIGRQVRHNFVPLSGMGKHISL